MINDDFNKKKTHNIKIRGVKNFDENLYKTDLKEIENTDLTNCQNVNKMYSLFQTQILNVVKRLARYRKLSK